jgi:argininosuccinate lyase
MDMFRGRLTHSLDKTVSKFISSLEEDARLISSDISVLQAHNLMLYKQKYLEKSDIEKILLGLDDAINDKNLKKNLENPDYFDPNYYDIHPIIEKYVIDRYTIDIGGKTHLAKSRNDQVMTDIRIYVRDEILKISSALLGLTKSLIELSEEHKGTIMCGYTHMQPAQAITYGHYLLSYFDVFCRDLKRLLQAYDQTNVSPLGASALAGTTINIDRQYTADLLGFDKVLENTVDAVSNRDFMLETGFCLTLIMTSLSRMAEDYILWSTQEYGLVELSDEFTDTSTSMPQKKNASLFDMVRGKTGTSTGTLLQLFSTVKGLPTGYNQDLQELKHSLWELIDTTKTSIDISKRMIETAQVNKDNMLESAVRNYVTAIDLAEYITQEAKVSFREANILVCNIIRELLTKKIALSDLKADQVNKISKATIGKEVLLQDDQLKIAVNPVFSIQRRRGVGNPSPSEVTRMIKERNGLVTDIEYSITTRAEKIEMASDERQREVNRILGR